MAERAHVTSVEAMESFRADLLQYLAKAKPALEDVFDEVAHTREWVETDRRTYWEQQLKRRTKVLNDAQQALFSARMLNLRSPTTAEQAAVTAAKRAVDEAENKLRAVKRWIRDFDNRVQPLLKELEHARTLLAREMPRAALFLEQLVRRLDEYRGGAAGVPSPGSRATGDPLDHRAAESPPSDRGDTLDSQEPEGETARKNSTI